MIKKINTTSINSVFWCINVQFIYTKTVGGYTYYYGLKMLKLMYFLLYNYILNCKYFHAFWIRQCLL